MHIESSQGKISLETAAAQTIERVGLNLDSKGALDSSRRISYYVLPYGHYVGLESESLVGRGCGFHMFS